MRLFTSESYLIASEKEKNKVCNGCGSKGFGGWIVPNTLWGLSIKEACNIHDWMYKSGKTIKHKKQADRAFLNNMIRVIENKNSSCIMKKLRHRRAKSYYQVVKYLGGPAFWRGKNKDSELLMVI